MKTFYVGTRVRHGGGCMGLYHRYWPSAKMVCDICGHVQGESSWRYQKLRVPTLEEVLARRNKNKTFAIATENLAQGIEASS